MQMIVPSRAPEYSEQWSAAVRRCRERLERHDDLRVEECKTLGSVKAALVLLCKEPLDEGVMESLYSMIPSLAMIDKFLSYLALSLSAQMDFGPFWGLIRLLLELSARELQATTKLMRMIKTLGNKTELLCLLCDNDATAERWKVAAFDVLLELLSFISDALCFLRDTNERDRSEEGAWTSLSQTYKQCIEQSEENIEQMERLIRLASHTTDFKQLRNLIGDHTAEFIDNAKLPCFMLPAAKNTRFFDRDNVIEQIDRHFCKDDDDEAKLRSLALYGLGGVGKSHIALKYAHHKKNYFKAVLWIHSATSASIEQSFTDIALRLRLDGADPKRHTENKIVVLEWLQQTKVKWLMVFDNAEDSDLLLEYWPVASTGCALITTRNHGLAYDPAEAGFEILHFEPDLGSKYVLHLLKMDVAQDIMAGEARSAFELSERLNGHALAISQMTALIFHRSWSIEEFITVYDRNTRELQNMRGPQTLDTVWRLSFQSLTPECLALLGVLSFVMPDSIPQAMFEFPTEAPLPGDLSFCAKEFHLLKAFDHLFTLALIRRDKTTGTLEIHRLVQSQFRYFLTDQQRQEAFDNTILVLFEKFPQSDAKRGQLYDRWTQCQLYKQHILSVKDCFKIELEGPAPIKPSITFCKLLKSFARFLLESAAYLEVEDVLLVGRKAFDGLDEHVKDLALLADICASTGLMWAHRGMFHLSEPFQRQANDLRATITPFDRLELSWTEVNLANVVGSRGQYRESLDFQISALRNRQMEGADDLTVATTPQGLLYQNIGRSHLLVGRFEEAHVWCHMAIDLLSRSQNWAMLAYTHFVLGNVYRAEANLKMAKQEFTTATEVWSLKGQLRTHHFYAACIYKLGCVALDTGDVVTAINELRASLTIAKIHERVLNGDYARVLWKLSKALLATGDEHALESKAKFDQANTILAARREVLSLKRVEDSEKAYDDLVYILWR